MGPIFFDYKLTRETYLENILPEVAELLERMFSAEKLEQIIWQQDGAPPHSVLEVRDGAPISWPPKSPDLTPLDTFLWLFLRKKIYFSNKDNIVMIKNKIEALISDLNQSHNKNSLNNLR